NGWIGWKCWLLKSLPPVRLLPAIGCRAEDDCCLWGAWHLPATCNRFCLNGTAATLSLGTSTVYCVLTYAKSREGHRDESRLRRPGGTARGLSLWGVARATAGSE